MGNINTNRLYELSEKIDKILQNEIDCHDTKEIVDEIKSIVSDFKQGSIGLAQINPIAGDIQC